MKTWSLPSKVHKYLYRGDFHRALGVLSDITAINTETFAENDEDYLRYVGYFRIQLLMDIGYYREALAWACLECDMYPDSSEGLFLKETLKNEIKNLPDGHTIIDQSAHIKTDWGSVVGMRELKGTIERDLILPLNNPEEYKKYGLRIPQGFLFYGPPGCGKTIVAKQIARILGFNFIEVLPSTTGSIYVHGTQNKIKELFEEAAKKKPCLLFIDEFDAFAPDRSKPNLSHHYEAEVNELLIHLNNTHNNGILVIAATNYINKIDPSVLRPGRIDKKIFIGPPDFEARLEAFKFYLANTPYQIKKWEYLGEETEFLTYAEIKFIVEEAKRSAKDELKPVDLNFIMKAVLQNPPSLSKKKIQDYQK